MSYEITRYIALLTIYDKQDAQTVDLKVIRRMAQELGFTV